MITLSVLKSFLLASTIYHLTESSRAEKDTLFEATGTIDVIFTDDLLFESSARSVIDCGRQCSNLVCCVTFTFSKVTSSGSCRGHSNGTMTLQNDHQYTAETVAYVLTDRLKSVSVPSNCAEAIQKGLGCGVHQLQVSDVMNVTAYCDGEWTVFQRRQDGSTDFNRGWNDYKNGFGNAHGEFWLGLEAIHLMTSKVWYELRVDLGDWDGNTAYATYSHFYVQSADWNYQLILDSYTGGSAGDSLMSHNASQFTTKDANNDPIADSNCAVDYEAGWWFVDCGYSILNGPHVPKNQDLGTFWVSWSDDSLKFSEMKMRPML